MGPAREQAMNHQPESTDSLVRSYLGLRMAGGLIGMALPFVLALGNMALEGFGIQSSISGYYHTGMRDVFVGSLCAIGVFLVSCSGYDRSDAIAGDLACIFAVGVALFPIAPEVNATPREHFFGSLHLLCAAGFFLTLSFLALVLFRRTDRPKTEQTRQKTQRNAVYAVCGYTMLVCLALIVIVKSIFNTAAVRKFAPVFWLEGVAIFAFGVCWIIKGEALLGDPGGPRPWPAPLERLFKRRS
jgi:hypothetical protein